MKKVNSVDPQSIRHRSILWRGTGTASQTTASALESETDDI